MECYGMPLLPASLPRQHLPPRRQDQRGQDELRVGVLPTCAKAVMTQLARCEKKKRISIGGARTWPASRPLGLGHHGKSRVGSCPQTALVFVESLFACSNACLLISLLAYQVDCFLRPACLFAYSSACVLWLNNLLAY